MLTEKNPARQGRRAGSRNHWPIGLRRRLARSGYQIVRMAYCSRVAGAPCPRMVVCVPVYVWTLQTKRQRS